MWTSSDERQFYDSFRVETDVCTLVLAVRSTGSLRPARIDPSDDVQALEDHSSNERPLELFTNRVRTFEELGYERSSIGAVAFEADGTATDFWIHPEEAPPEPETPVDDWLTFERDHPSLGACYDEGERVLRSILRSLSPRRAFTPAPARVEFGWDEVADRSLQHQAELPPGWVVSWRPTFEGSIPLIHPRPIWSWDYAEPSPRAEVWTYTGGDDRPPARGRRVLLFGQAFRFRSDHCGHLPSNDRRPVASYVCLHGDSEERHTLLRVLRRFTPASDGEPDEVEEPHRSVGAQPLAEVPEKTTGLRPKP